MRSGVRSERIEVVLDRIEHVVPQHDGSHMGRCPAHQDGRPSLHITETNSGAVLLHCFAGCTPAEIMSAIGLTMSDLMPPPPGPLERSAHPVRPMDRASEPMKRPAPWERPVEKIYNYHNESGALVHQTVRFADEKAFSQRKPNGSGGWKWSLGGIEPVLYRLPELLASDPASWVFLCEGEKDADNLAAHGLTATTNPMGAEKWRQSYSDTLAGRRIALMVDNDDSGEKHVKKVTEALHAVGCHVRVIRLDGLPPKGDVSNWLEAGHTAAELLKIVDATADWPAGGEPDPSPPAAAPAKRGRPSNSQKIVELVTTRLGASFWHTPDHQPYLSLPVNGHVEHHLLSSKQWETLLAFLYWGAFREVPGSQAIKDASATLAGIALHEGECHQIHVRIAHHNGEIWVDRGSTDRRAIRITDEGWSSVESSVIPVKFYRPGSMSELPEPTRGGTLEDLRALFGIGGDEWILICGWLVGCFQPSGARAFLEISGAQGSGKSTLLRFLIALIDPAKIDLRSLPRDEEDLIVAVLYRVVLAFDNISRILPELADAFCRIATGGGIGKRGLFTDADEVILKAQMPLAWCGINSVAASYSDLQDRTLSVVIGALDGRSRLTELKLWTAFTQMHASLLGALYDVVSVALSRIDVVPQPEELPRLADFAQWIEAAAPGLDWHEGDFIAAYGSAQRKSSQLTVDQTTIGDLLVKMVGERDRWELTADELLVELRSRADDERKRQRGFPKQPNQVSRQLNRIQGALRDVGVHITFDRDRDRRAIIIERISEVFDAAGSVANERQAAMEPRDVGIPVDDPATCVEGGCNESVAPGSRYYCAMHARSDQAAS